MRTVLAFIVTFVCSLPIYAGILGRETSDVFVTKEKQTPGVTWSKESKLTDAGLVPSKTGDFWIQTDRIPAGLSWRPPTATGVTLSIDALNVPATMHAYVRYGCDGKHWSTWQVMSELKFDDESDLYRAKCRLQIPSVAVERHSALYYEWLNTKPNWPSDEDALCRWISKQDPKFFEKEIPVIGYLQFRLEDYSGNRNMILSKLIVRADWGVGGVHSEPKSGKPDYGKKWSFGGTP